MRVRSLETEVPLGLREGLSRKWVTNADNLHTLPKSLLDARIGALSVDKARALGAAIKLARSLL